MTKKGTILTSWGGCSANHDSSAVLPAHASARHQAYAGPESAVQKAVSSASSRSRPTSSPGAILRTCSQYAERTCRVNTRWLWSPVTATPTSRPAATDRSALFPHHHMPS
ncbi:hypothetical protein [Streptomyces afghaniensis]|uniref:hypothetical protein n=1 Tax=Streptomyces afghaniensis TaxID=66865 RepID=UPI00278387FA|nr:hypothetical protein [Streptomyces afghaniensis]MDQ1016948.1 hypothetical protein [Streptomyces afghaniensis]